MSKQKRESAETLGEYVRRKREAVSMSQRQLAAEAGVSFSNISRLESGFHASPSPELLKNIADVLDVDLAKLLSYRGIEIAGARGSLNDYLRRDYELPEEGIEEAKAAIEEIASKYRPRKRISQADSDVEPKQP
jgi:transcriptional regulator with XRE-family HTH domain